MRKWLIIILPTFLGGCSYYNSFMERMNTESLQYQCNEQLLTVEHHKQRQQVNLVYKDKPLTLTQGLSASGSRYSDGVWVFWEQGNSAALYYQDNIVLHHCQLQAAQR